MPRFFFKADYGNGCTCMDETGEEFDTLEQAQAHASIVSDELGRNMPWRVTVQVVDRQGGMLSMVEQDSSKQRDH
jgi:hypothetical protein